MLLLQVLVVLVLVVASVALAAYDARRDARATATDRAVAVARAVADSPTVVEALGRTDPSQPSSRTPSGCAGTPDVDFVVVMALDRTRYTHPDPDNIGKPFVGDLGGAPDGQRVHPAVHRHPGPVDAGRGPRVRADGSEVVAWSRSASPSPSIDRAAARRPGADRAARALAVLAVGLARRLAGRPPAAPADARAGRSRDHPDVRVLHGRPARRPRGAAAARRRRPGPARQRRGAPAARPAGRRRRPPRSTTSAWRPGLVAAALGGPPRPTTSTSPATGSWSSARRRPRWEGRDVGAVVTLRDHTELRAVTGELDVVRGLTESLRAQNHEAANRLHTVVSLIEMGRPDEAVEFATEELAARPAAHRPGRRRRRRPGGRRAAARQDRRGRRARRRPARRAASCRPTVDVPARDLVTVLGNLVDNAFDARGRRPTCAGVRGHASGGDAERRRGRRSATAVRASTTTAAAHALERGWSTKGSGERRPRRRAGAGRAGRAAARRRRSTSAGPTLGGAEFTVTLRRMRGERDVTRARARRRGRAARGRGARGVRRAGRPASSSPASPGRPARRPGSSTATRGRPGPARHAPARRARPRRCCSGCARPATWST